MLTQPINSGGVGNEEKPTKCPTCGASMKEPWHTLTPGLVQILIKCLKAVKENNKNLFHWEKDVKMSNTESHNFTKLRYHALIAKSGRRGYWVLTDRAGKFLRGEMEVPRRVKTFHNKVIGHDTQTVHVKGLVGQMPWLESEFDFDIHDGLLVHKITKQLTLI